MLYGSRKPRRKSYEMCRQYQIEYHIDGMELDIKLVDTNMEPLPRPYEILKRTILRTDENDARIAPLKREIKIPLAIVSDVCKPN